MSSTRKKWMDLYQTEIPALARLISSSLIARGFTAKYQRKKPKGQSESAPFVRIEYSELEPATNLLSKYNLVNSN
ncbi:MAG: hypothetical protein OEZ33_06630 [Gammaproteobacteria bacterium]|nr:hypothetical protein [Gammaproteobacteria bacterium]MDH5777866.1 hypothetical protein [Gammaproteobacteria bacterium]